MEILFIISPPQKEIIIIIEQKTSFFGLHYYW